MTPNHALLTSTLDVTILVSYVYFKAKRAYVIVDILHEFTVTMIKSDED
jgi:hypothetical protein